jgi:Fe-S-cluster containining protein
MRRVILESMQGTPGDAALIQIVDAALAEAARKSGPWLACRPGCAECCIGPFAITPLDAARLTRGLADLETLDPARAARVRARATEAVRRLERDYPGNTLARVLREDDAAENDPCPALDPDTKTCDLYDARPITCRTFGPAVSFGGDALAVCELCYHGATDAEIAACEVEIDPGNLEARLLHGLPASGDTIVAFALTAEY